MLESGDAIDSADELAPAVALLGEDGGASRRELVVAAAALARLLDPAPLNPAALLEAVEQRIQRRDAEAEHAARARLDQLAQLVAVARLRFDERQDEQLGAALLQLAVED